MQTNPVGTTWQFGNHALTDAEVAAGQTPRDPFFERVDGVNVPVDPDEVEETVTNPDGETSVYRWPTAGPTDAGVLTRESTGRFFVYVTPLSGQDGKWRWSLKGGMLLGTGTSDQGVVYVQREIAPGP